MPAEVHSGSTRAEDFLGKIVEVTIDRVLGTHHPEHLDIAYGVNYGYVPGTRSPDGEELDAYVLGVEEPLQEFRGRCIGIIRRSSESDDKLIVVPEGASFDVPAIKSLVAFQERFFRSVLIREFVTCELY